MLSTKFLIMVHSVYSMKPIDNTKNTLLLQLYFCQEKYAVIRKSGNVQQYQCLFFYISQFLKNFCYRSLFHFPIIFYCDLDSVLICCVFFNIDIQLKTLYSVELFEESAL